jgi:ADP-ribose pyrophosphatase YjhB (NUDIX family)
MTFLAPVSFPQMTLIACLATVNDAGEILMIRRTDNGNWALPGGAVDLGESFAQAAIRKTLEESGIECAITGIVGIYSDPRHVILYTSNGEVRQKFSIVLTARPWPDNRRQQRVKRGPLGAGIRGCQVHDGLLNARPHQRLPGMQPVAGDYLDRPSRGLDRASRTVGRRVSIVRTISVSLPSRIPRPGHPAFHRIQAPLRLLRPVVCRYSGTGQRGPGW